MRPWQHACSSTQTATPADNPAWHDALAVHEFLDISKMSCADRRHRIVLHHVDLGATIARRAFPTSHCIDENVRQHVREDLGHEATLEDWFLHVDMSRLPRPVIRRIEMGPTELARYVAARLPDHHDLRDAVDTVAHFLFLPQEYLPGAPEAALAVLMNTTGIALVRRIFGPPQIETHHACRVAVDWGWIAEAIVMTSYGRIPDLRELVDTVTAEPARRDADAGREAA